VAHRPPWRTSGALADPRVKADRSNHRIVGSRAVAGHAVTDGGGGPGTATGSALTGGNRGPAGTGRPLAPQGLFTLPPVGRHGQGQGRRLAGSLPAHLMVPACQPTAPWPPSASPREQLRMNRTPRQNDRALHHNLTAMPPRNSPTSTLSRRPRD
jgi:hypothetical protein